MLLHSHQLCVLESSRLPKLPPTNVSEVIVPHFRSCILCAYKNCLHFHVNALRFLMHNIGIKHANNNRTHAAHELNNSTMWKPTRACGLLIINAAYHTRLYILSFRVNIPVSYRPCVVPNIFAPTIKAQRQQSRSKINNRKLFYFSAVTLVLKR